MSTEPKKILVDVDVIEALLNGFGDDNPHDDLLVSAAQSDLRQRIQDARRTP